MAKIIIFRHAQSTDNAPINMFSGWRNPELTADGIREAQGMRDRLSGYKVTRAYSSDAIRTIHTLQIVMEQHQGVEIIEDPRIKERNYGDLTGKVKKEIAQQFPDLYPLWHRSYDVPPPNGESVKDVEVRVNSFLEEILSNLSEDDVVFICTSGNAVRPMRKRFEGLTVEQMCSFEHEPGKIYEYQL